MSIDVYITTGIWKQSLLHTWRTSIQETVDGYEKRSSLVTRPTVKLENELCFNNAGKRRYIHSQLECNTFEIWGWPFMFDKTSLISEATSGQKILSLIGTVNRHFYNDRGLILVDPDNWENYEYGIIDTVDSNTQITMLSNLAITWPSGTYVYPMYEYRIGETQDIKIPFRFLNELKIIAAESFESEVSFSYSVPSSGAPTYKTLDLFLILPLSSVTNKYKHPFEKIAFLGQNYFSSLYDKSSLSFAFDFLLSSREEIWDLLNFFDSKRGRFQTFYMPSWNEDIIPTAAIGSADTTLTVEKIYLVSSDIVGRYLYIKFPDDSYVCREITGLPTATSIQIDSAIGTDVSESQLSDMLLSFLYLVRFDVDEILFEYNVVGNVYTKLRFKSVL